MTTFNKVLALKRELKRINKKIDLRIAVGMSYRREAEYHKRITRELQTLTRYNWFARFAF